MRIIYNLLMGMAFLLGWPLILYMTATSRKRRHTVRHRLGLKPFPRKGVDDKSSALPDKPVWVHALSVGEVMSAVPLVKQIGDTFKHKKIIFSVSTETGFEIARRFLASSVDAVIYFPYDILFSVKRALTTINPDVVIIVESDIWPNFLYEIQKRKIPAFLVNARLSDRSLSGYRRISFFTRPLFSVFRTICTQSADDTSRFEQLGIPGDRIVTTGNIKFDQEDAPVTPGQTDRLRHELNIDRDRRVLIAGSTHENEEEILLAAYRQLKQRFPDLLLIAAPRNIDRSESVKSIFSNAGFASVLMQDISSDRKQPRDVIIVDTLGLLRKLYVLADITFIGGSLVNLGGHNPLEPAVFSKPILFGPDMSNFKSVSGMLLENNGACIVSNAADLFQATATFLENPIQAQQTGRNAYDAFRSNVGAVNRTIVTIRNNLESL